MYKNKKTVLLVTPFFRPNTGGAETYANEICEYLRRHDYFVFVLTFKPLSANLPYQKHEMGENINIRRYWWIGGNLFHKLERYPFLNFLYLTPILFIRTFFWMLFNSNKVDVIDAQGFNSAFAARLIKIIFHKRVVATIVSLYDFIPGSPLAKKIYWILKEMDHVIVESEVSKKEINSIGIENNKITPYVEWVDLEKFRPKDKQRQKGKLKLPKNFLVLFVARAIPIKGADLLLEAAKKLNDLDITFLFISRDGPMVGTLRQAEKYMPNVKFIEGVPYETLGEYYAAADIFVIPSRYSENAARTVIEAIACGTIAIGTNKGAIPSLIEPSVGIIVEPDADEITEAIKKIFTNKSLYTEMTGNTRAYAENKFSLDNAKAVTQSYES